MPYAKQYSFLHPIADYYTPGYKAITPYQVYVSYKLHSNGRVEIINTAYHPDITPKINGYARLNNDIQAAAEIDSKKYLRPGQYRGRAEMPQPGEDPHHDAKLETNWK